MRTKLFISVFALGLAFTAAVPIVAEEFFYPSDGLVIVSPDTDNEDTGGSRNGTSGDDTEQPTQTAQPSDISSGSASAQTQSISPIPEAPTEPAGNGEETKSESGLPVSDNSVIRVYMADKGETVSMTLGEYVCGAVLAEMPSSFHSEALKAQAVASRTYCIYRAGHPSGHENAIICTDYTHCAAFMSTDKLAESVGGEQAAKISAIIKSAVTATAGEILTYEGSPALAAFHACSSGYTERADAVWSEAVPYLISVSSPETPSSKDISFTADELILKLSLPGGSKNTLSVSPATAIRIGRDASGRVESAWICGKVLSGTELRTLLSLPSASFSVKQSDGSFIFTVLGSGHGVGMSQYGADAMADSGKSYRQILAHYYQGTDLNQLGKQE